MCIILCGNVNYRQLALCYNNHIVANHHIIGTNYTTQPYRQQEALCEAVEAIYEDTGLHMHTMTEHSYHDQLKALSIS